MGDREQVPHAPVWPSPARAWWTVGVLAFAYIVSFVDRTILSLLIEPIKSDLALNDTQIALVQGLAFGLFYAIMGVPLGWLADRMSRRFLIALGALLWCLATAACGLATSFVGLFVARVAVGVGEAVLSPAAMSTISDSFPRDRRGLPIGVYAAAAAAGAGLALMVGGGVVEVVARSEGFALPFLPRLASWQSAFVLIGLMGLVVVPLMATVVEPQRKHEPGQPREGGLVAFIRDNADFMLRHYAAVGVYTIVIYATLSWVPAYFIRVFGWTPGEVGFRYGAVLLVFGGCGTVLGAWLATRLARRGVRQAAIVVTCLGMLGAALFLGLAGFAADPWVALALYCPGLCFMTLPGGTAIQVVQEAVPAHLRARASAVYYLVISLVGLTTGPLAVALFTDYVYGDPSRIGDGLGWVAFTIGPVSAALAISTRRPFARLTDRDAAAALAARA